MLDRITNWFDQNLVSRWREAWNLASIRLAAIFAAISGVILSDPTAIVAVAGLLPHGGITRYVAIGFIMFGIFVVPVLIRLWKQDDKRG